MTVGVIGTVEETALGAATGGTGGAALALLKRYWKPLAVGLIVLGIAVAVLSHFANDRHTRKELANLQEWQKLVVATVQSGVPAKTKVDPDHAVVDLQWIISQKARAEKALADQSAALTKAKADAAAAQNNAVAARKQAKERDAALEATRAALTDPKRHSGLTAAEWGQL